MSMVRSAPPRTSKGVVGGATGRSSEGVKRPASRQVAQIGKLEGASSFKAVGSHPSARPARPAQRWVGPCLALVGVLLATGIAGGIVVARRSGCRTGQCRFVSTFHGSRPGTPEYAWHDESEATLGEQGQAICAALRRGAAPRAIVEDNPPPDGSPNAVVAMVKAAPLICPDQKRAVTAALGAGRTTATPTPPSTAAPLVTPP